MRMRTWARAAVCVASAALLVAATAVPAGAAGRDRTPPTAPANLRVTGVTPTTISLAWDASRDAGGLNAYIVYQSSSVGEWGLYHSPSSTTETDEIGVRGFTRTYWIVAEDKAGNRSAPSNRVTATTTPDTSPPTAPVLTVTGVTQSTAALSWTASTDDAGSPGYRIFVNGAPWEFLAPTATAGLARTVRRLTPGTTYTFTVRAADAAGNLSPPSNAATATTQPSTDTSPPTAPGGLRITRDSGCDVDLVWTASTDNVEPASAIEYEIVVNGGVQRIVTGVTSTFAYHGSVDGLNTFAVRAVDRAGNASAPSNAVTSPFQEC
ncbi:fibronectin type III domain-containing protein [Phytohabitans sp. ZYX-F-186]|uniref:Fibronectin type III domain-containing protein n=1 Tax=Phytohabitans maris TaxID=3071409 RepID=A0ABU0ZVF2_9ACTN|nr:fibronectin type III domain-containing protein [Phytohabitans sp. ZYX-F-186]MDQ7911023.1 fibronectin type III domain-containing protein [Phytohabitans sp. ZYX-F-186]